MAEVKLEEFTQLPEHLQIKSHNLDPAYEYGEIVFTQVEISLLKENAKLLPEMQEDDPRRKKVEDLVRYFDLYLPQEGWQIYEVAMINNGMKEARRFRRLKPEQDQPKTLGLADRLLRLFKD